ncbi:MAG: hypothetical protein K2I70_05950, partial [Bacilli bacterium]|nr:hypothetical protein [Bacilli bacterium]
MTNIKLNIKKLFMRNVLALVLLSTPATLTGCGKNTEVEEETNSTYVWADDKGVVEYIPNNINDDEVKTIHYLDYKGILKTTYIDTQFLNEYLCQDTNGVIIYNTVDEKKLNNFIKRNNLINIPDNLDELIEDTKDNNISLGYEYSGKDDNIEYTGKVYLTVHYYQTYKIEVNENGKCVLVEGPVILNMEDWYEEFPYIKEKYDQTFTYDISDLAQEKIDELIKNIQTNGSKNYRPNKLKEKKLM